MHGDFHFSQILYFVYAGVHIFTNFRQLWFRDILQIYKCVCERKRMSSLCMCGDRISGFWCFA